MNTDGEHELGRPRYRSGPGERAAPGTVPARGAGPDAVRKTAPAAVVALLFAAVGWLIPVLGGALAVRRANAALRAIAASGGELDGVPLAVWARRLGWLYVAVWSALLFWRYGGPLIQLIYSFLVK